MRTIRNIEYNYSAYEVILFVHELHKKGYEQLRLVSGISPSGLSWRWMVFPKVFMIMGNSFEHNCDGVPFKYLHGSTGEGYPVNREVYSADDFIKGNEWYIELAKGSDQNYVKWFDNVFSHAQLNDFPIAFEERSSAEQWRFMSREKLSYPPFEEFNCDELSDDTIIEIAKHTFNNESVEELKEILTYKGAKMNQHEIASVIRQTIRENKGLISHLNVYPTNRLELITWGKNY
jgi:hypothetical protein